MGSTEVFAERALDTVDDGRHDCGSVVRFGLNEETGNEFEVLRSSDRPLKKTSLNTTGGEHRMGKRMRVRGYGC